MLSVVQPHGPKTELRPVRPLVIPTQPADDESLPGLLARATQRNVLGVTRIILNEVGLELPRPGLVGQEIGNLSGHLACKIGCSPNEVRVRCYQYVSGRGERSLVQWGGAEIRRSDLTLARRRISPATLQGQDQHLAAWLLLPLAYCPKSFERLIDRCSTCDEALGWVAARGIGVCEHCRTMVLHPDGEVLPHNLRPGYSIFADLLSIVPEVRQRRLADYAQEIRSLPLSDLLDLIIRLGRIVLGLGSLHRGRIATSDPFLSASIAVIGTELLSDWPTKLRQRLGAIGTDSAYDPRDTLRLVKRLGGSDLSTVVAASIRQGLPELFGRGRHSLASLAGPVRHPLYFMRIGGFSSEQYRILRDNKLLGDTVPTGDARPSIQFSREVADDLISAKRSSEPFSRLAQTLRAPRYAVEQLICLGEVEHTARPAFDALKMAPRIDIENRRKLVEVLLSAPDDVPDDASPLFHLMRRFTGGEKPWGAVIGALRRRELPFCLSPAVVCDNGREELVLRRVRVLPGDFESLHITPFHLDAFSDFPFETSMPRNDALEVLGVKDAALKAAIECGDLELRSDRGRSDLLDRSEVRGLAQTYVSAQEMGYRLRLRSNNMAPRYMADFPSIERRALGWLREDCRRDLPHLFI